MIPLGILATTAGGGGGGIPAYELISTAYGTGSSATVTFTSIPSDYKHLQVRWTGRATGTNDRAVRVQFNGVTASSYSNHSLIGNGSYMESSSAANWGSIETYISVVPGSSRSANIHAAGILDILDYASTSKYKTTRQFISKTNDANVAVMLTSGSFRSSDAISSMSLILDGGTWGTTSRLSLYGILG